MIDWLQHSTGGLLTLAAVSIAVLLFLIIKVKLEPFIALIVVGLLTALAAGLPVVQIVGSAQKASDSLLEKGFGGILGHIAAIIGLGTILGSILERSGGAKVLTSALLRAIGEKRAPLAMGLAGFVFGIPVFFDIGIFVLAPLVYVAAKQGGRSLVLYALPLLAGLSITHAFLPPHPGPVAAAGLLHVELGWIILMGLVCGIPAFLVGGVLYSTWIGKRVDVRVPAEFLVAEEEGEKETNPPSLGLVLGIIAVPLVLILAGTFGSIWLPKASAAAGVAAFIGTPAVALTVSVLLASWLLGLRRGLTGKDLSELSAKSLRPVAMILLVVGAGAFFGAVLSATGIGKAVAGSLDNAGLPVILAAYVISCGMRIAQGSATVAIVTTSGIVAPTVATLGYSQMQLALLVVAISAGSIIASHVNDGGFWIISRYFNMTVPETLKTWTVLETVLSVSGFGVAALLMAVV
ncbi:GntP family permease [Amycolatopsis keratiniphila]|uniref:Permease n=1 Tax=Amycolatopsis keratiniphila subsp. keratiniphila TaxID=227715 RepID=A0A1W2LG07_9PSEU|nr:gluconate:H+ symporter [Amycolatopsis keratiniphila]OLZ59077.1 permease [Amycolatopsis keratiniphila subsp. nogabecina]ONF61789.1 permease [Amycolatopsis keratiniphila subsp. keratiniphila]SDU04987.1 gluconate:H+ symporter, GntP family [Amycolatopsis keratiniphila]